MFEENYKIAGENNREYAQKRDFSSLVESARDGKLLLYGAGNTGKRVCDACSNRGINVAHFIDKEKTGDYRGVPILPWSSLESDFRNETSFSIVITAHNPDVDIPTLKSEISSVLGDGSNVYSLMDFYLAMEQEGIRFPDQFWVGQNLIANKAKIEEARALLADQKSLAFYDAQVELRKTGCYSPVLSCVDGDDFYLPDFLPELGRLDFVDGGAFDGDTIDLFINHGIEFNEIYCFEPDISNHKAFLERIRNSKINGTNHVVPTGSLQFESITKIYRRGRTIIRNFPRGDDDYSGSRS